MYIYRGAITISKMSRSAFRKKKVACCDFTLCTVRNRTWHDDALGDGGLCTRPSLFLSRVEKKPRPPRTPESAAAEVKKLEGAVIHCAQGVGWGGGAPLQKRTF